MTSPAPTSVSHRPSLTWGAMLLLMLLWLLVRAYPIYQHNPMLAWESWQAHKLLDYGFLERHGALIDVHFEGGRLPDPAKFNFVHHPLPMVWFDTLIFALGGPWLLEIFHIVLKLGVFLLFARVLAHLAGRWAAFFTAVLALLAPQPLLWDMESNVITVGALLWPVSLWLILRSQRSPEHAARLPSQLGLSVFLSGQISWMAITYIPALLVATAPAGFRLTLGEIVTQLRQNRSWRAILLSCFATCTLFFVLLYLYSPGSEKNITDIISQAGFGSVTSRSRMLVMIVLRSVLFCGLPLILLGLCGIVASWRQRTWHPFVLAALVYLPCFAITGAVLTNFFFVETTPYIYPVFALTPPAAIALQYLADRLSQAWRRWATIGLTLLALPHLAYVFYQSSWDELSPSAQVLAKAMAEETKPEDLILTNVSSLAPPFALWDLSFETAMRSWVDRYSRTWWGQQEEFRKIRNFFPNAPFTYVRAVEGAPLQPALEELLAKYPATKSREVTLPAEPLGWQHGVRNFIWKVNRKYGDRPPLQSLPERKVTLQFHALPADLQQLP